MVKWWWKAWSGSKEWSSLRHVDIIAECDHKAKEAAPGYMTRKSLCMPKSRASPFVASASLLYMPVQIQHEFTQANSDTASEQLCLDSSRGWCSGFIALIRWQAACSAGEHKKRLLHTKSCHAVKLNLRSGEGQDESALQGMAATHGMAGNHAGTGRCVIMAVVHRWRF